MTQKLQFSLLLMLLQLVWSVDLVQAKCIAKRKYTLDGDYKGCEVQLTQDGSNNKKTLYTSRSVNEKDCTFYCKNIALVSLKSVTSINSSVQQVSQQKKRCPSKFRRGDMIQDIIGNRETTEALPELKGYYGFNKLFNELSNPDENLCNQNRDEIRQKSLKAMNQALSFYYGEKPISVDADDFKNEGKFRDKMVLMWGMLISSVKNMNQKLAGISKQTDQGGGGPFRRSNATLNTPARLDATISFVKKSLDLGNIPLPSFLEEEEEGKSHFTYSSLSKYFLLGIAPVTVKKASDKSLAQRSEHPFNPGFLDGMYAIMDHDIQHSSTVMGAIYGDLNLQDPKNCNKMRECLRNMTGIDKGPIRKALFYLLHEDPRPLLKRDFSYITDNIALEFATESVLNRNDQKFSQDLFLGQTLPEKLKACGTINEIQKKMDELTKLTLTFQSSGDFSALQVLQEKSEEFLKVTQSLDILFPPSLIDLVQENATTIADLDFGEQAFDNLPMLKDVRKKILTGVVRRIMPKLMAKCNADFPSRTYLSDPSHVTLTNNIQKMENAGFSKSLESELKKLFGSIDVIKESFANNPACQGILKREPTVVSEPGRAEDLGG